MSTIEYKLERSPGKGASYAWNKDEFYTSAVVVGVDIGLEGIGVWIRRGMTPLFGRTFLFDVPEAAPLQRRRGLRAGRRCRQAERRREVMLKGFCKEFGLPWVEITDKGHDDGPFRFRWIATRRDVSGLKDVRAFAACLRHIIRHRGYDWHSPEAGAEYPWGAEGKAKDAIEWAKTAFCRQEHADELRYMVSDLGWSEKEYETFETGLKGAVERYNTKGIDAVLAEHFAQPKNNLCAPARRYNFPREMVWDHLRCIVEKHPQFVGGANRLPEALAKLENIINDHRKEPGALAMRKVNRCPLASVLFGCAPPKCDPASNRDVRRFKLLEFLATWTFVLKDGQRMLASAAAIAWLLDDLLEADVAAVASKGKAQRTKLDKREFKKTFLEKQQAGEALELAPDKQSHNGEFFTQLMDLLWPKLSELGGRASLCGSSAAALVEYATKEGLDPAVIATRLKEKRFGAAGRKMSLYEIRQTAAAGFGLYKQVEFLLGRCKKNSKPGDKPAVPGALRQIFAQLTREGLLPADTKAPDYFVIETVGDIPRNREQAKEIQKEQAARREYKEGLYEQFRKYDRGGINPDEVNKRLLLYDQQRGFCPYTGNDLGENPLSKELEIDHVFPRSRGGLSELVNLVLTHRETNDQKKERTPYEAFGGKTDTHQWREIKERVLRMQWNGKKRELFLSAEETPPDWENMTRVAQLARQLRFEAARWMGIADDDTEVRRRIGTPTGYQTSVCREAWAGKLPDGLYPKKDRDNLRHHMWDAAVIAHIPPGKGLNHVRYGGIFQSSANGGKIKMTALEGLGPDLKQFEEETALRCMVEKVQPAHSKRSRFEQWIYSPPDKEGRMWARDSLDALADKENLLELLRAAGIDERQLPTRRFEAWQEKRQAQYFTREEARAAVDSLQLPTEHRVPEEVFEAWWSDRLKGDRKKVTEASLGALMAKARVPKAAVRPGSLAGVLLNRGNPGPLTRKDGTIIRGVSGMAAIMTPMAIVPHRNHKGETIGFKLAKESFSREEVWTTEPADKKGKLVVKYYRRLIPHPRGLKNLAQRKLESTGEQLTWNRPLTDAEITELGLDENGVVQKYRREYQKALKAHGRVKDKANRAELGLCAEKVPGAPVAPRMSLRKIFTGLPPNAKRLRNVHGADISRLANGDLLRVPLTREGKICEEGQPCYREYWYRVAGLKTNGQIELALAERKQPKPLTERDLKEGRKEDPEKEWLRKVAVRQPSSDSVIAFLLRHTRGDDKPSDTRKGGPDCD